MDCGGFIKHSPLFERVHLRKEVAPTYSFETAQLAKSSFALFEKLSKKRDRKDQLPSKGKQTLPVLRGKPRDSMGN
ncbi:hypothetical protein Sjap_026674 [Stephania japonica]|uniref:Uncharacterized protein n=1 Tax=Stephania japonica TaxID=461633 RepID=A0AAP0HE97_9MAGN